MRSMRCSRLCCGWVGLIAAAACSEPAPLSAPGVGDPVAPAADPAPAAPETPPETEPAIVAYATPVVEEAFVVRKGPKAQIRLRWSKVEGAKKYEVQISKFLTFSRST